MKLTQRQAKQLDDVVRHTRITRGKNEGKRKDGVMDIEHFDFRSFGKLIENKLVVPDEYGRGWFASDLGFQVWKGSK
jgi:hypothetical protein